MFCFQKPTAASIVVALSFALLSACGTDASVFAGAVAIDRTTHALTAGELQSANGTYGANCRNRTGPWSVGIIDGATLDNPVLSVLLNDTACVLTLTSLHTTGGSLAATPAIVLTTAFATSASSMGTPTSFFANAKLSSVAFASAFVLTVVFSDDPKLASADNVANIDVVVATATSQAVPAPDFTIDVSGLVVVTDANNIIQSVTGAAHLTAGAVAGQSLVVLEAAGLTTYADIDTAFKGATPVAFTSDVAAAAFTLVGVDLTTPAVRTLIVSNTTNGVTSYESFEITFHPAP
jgi:hypothetical protein